MTKGVTFYFVRHGETYLNHLERLQGWADARLTPDLRTSSSMLSIRAIWVGPSKRLRFY